MEVAEEAKRTEVETLPAKPQKELEKGEDKMGYKHIRYETDFEDKDIAKDAMKKAKAYDAMGIGKWRIESIDDKINYLFIPGKALAPLLNRHDYMWMKMARDTTEAFEKELPGHKFKYFLE